MIRFLFSFVTVASQSHTVNGFINPTQLEGSKLTGYVDQRYTIVLYTSFSSQCEDVISLTEGVIVFPSVYDGYGSCVTEATVYLKEGESDICFQSAKTNFEIRCFTAEGLHNNTDPCIFSPCQNGGHCFPNGTNGTNETNEFHCICQEHYSGDLCQEGPCQLNDCMNNAYCKTINGTNNCVCKAGFTGKKCELNGANNNVEISFANSAIPESFQCVLDQSCSLALLLTCGKDIACRPGVKTAYISPTIKVGEISLISRNEPGSYQVNIKLVGKEVGQQHVCIWIHNDQGIFKDEMCFKVDIITDVSKVYGFQNRPHFIDPSLPNNASVVFTEEEQCHVLLNYQITRGYGNHHQCVSVKPGEFCKVQTYHIFTSCDLCTPTVGNCSVDVALRALSQYVGTVRHFCVEVSLIGSSTTGEERCINLKVVSKTKAEERKGCQLLESKNGGFCDGHVPDEPICYCRLGFTGKACDQDIYNSLEVLSQGLSNIQTFNGDLGIPSKIKCSVNRTCSVPFEVGAPTGGQPNIYISLDPSVSYEGHYFIPGMSNTTLLDLGMIDEMCVKVQFSDLTHSADLRRPRFVKPSLPHGSTIVCATNRSCHLLLNFTKADEFGFPDTCPTLTQLNSNNVEGLHIFQLEYNFNACLSDVVYSADIPVTRSLCLRLTLPGKNGEIRCYALKVVNNVTSEVHLSTNHNILVNPTVPSSLLSGMWSRTSLRISTQLTTIGSATITVPTAGNCGDDTVLTCHVTGSIGSTGWYGLSRILVTNGVPVRPEDNNMYIETRGASSFTLTIHNTDLTDEGEYRCENDFDESRLKRLNIECKASAANFSVTNGKKIAITVDKLYPSSPDFSVSFMKENTGVTVPGSRTCSSSTQYSGYYRCTWSSNSSVAVGSYTYSIVVTTITQADPLTGSFKLVSPQRPVVSNTVKVHNDTALFGNDGQTLTIECTSTGGYPIPTVAWYKDSISASNQLASNSTGILQIDSTYTVTVRHTFTPSNSDDNKPLICRSYYPQADSEYRASETTTVMLYLRLTVQSFSINGDFSQNSVTVAEHDADLQFICVVDRYPAASIRISFDGSILAERLNDMSLSFIRPDVACLHAGVYICEARDEYGYIPSKSITLFVKCSPRPVRQVPSNFTSNLHVPLRLRFDVIAHPEPGSKGFSWYMYRKGGVGWTPLLGNVDLKISSTGLQSNLALLNVSKEDFGRYKVIATNNIGSYEHQMFVFENVSETYKTYTDCVPCGRESNSLALIVGVALGLVSVSLAICLAYFVILYKRKCRQEGKSYDRPRVMRDNVNPTFATAAKELEEQCESDSTSKKGPQTEDYTDLFRYANTDKDTYDEIERA